MKLEPEDPRLSAWVLGELPPDEAEAIGRAVAGDPALQAQAEDLRGMGDFLTGTLAASSLLPDQREAVRRAGRAPQIANVVAFPETRKPKPQRRRVWPLQFGAAAALAFGLFLSSRSGSGDPVPTLTQGPAQEDREMALQPFPGPRISTLPASASQEQNKLVRGLRENPGPFLESLAKDLASQPLPEPSRLPATTPLPAMRSDVEIDLPVLVGSASYDWVRGWIREKNQLPPKDAVRIEELANAFPLPAAEETREFAGLKIACVSMASLWSGPGRLVGVQISNETDQARQVDWSFSPAAGSRQGGVRVLASTGGSGEGASSLPPGRRTLVLIELASASGDAGDLVVSSAGRSKRFPAVETQDPALKQAGLVAAFGIWLRGEGIDDSRLSAILASVGGENDPAWADSRRLVREALDIAAKAPAVKDSKR